MPSQEVVEAMKRLRAAKQRLDEAAKEREAAEAEWDAALKAFDKIEPGS